MKYIILPVLVCMGTSLFAQQSGGVINGTVMDKISQQPVQLVSVVLLTGKDSTVVKATVTDKKGRFILSDIVPGTYNIRYSFTGYVIPGTQGLTITGPQTIIELGTIQIMSGATTLKEVVVTGKKSLLRTSIDRKVLWHSACLSLPRQYTGSHCHASRRFIVRFMSFTLLFVI